MWKSRGLLRITHPGSPTPAAGAKAAALELLNYFSSILVEAVAVGVQEASTHAGGATFEKLQEIEDAEFEDIPLIGTCP